MLWKNEGKFIKPLLERPHLEKRKKEKSEIDNLCKQQTSHHMASHNFSKVLSKPAFLILFGSNMIQAQVSQLTNHHNGQ